MDELHRTARPEDSACGTMPHLIVSLNRQGLAIPTERVREILMTPKVIPLPGTPPHVRGVINVRGEVLQVVDLRLRMGMPPRSREIEDIVEILRAREEDHSNWIRELEASVREQRPFTLARDPHQCKFGKWYDTYQPDNVALQFIWSGFDQPHKRIHAVADLITAHVERGETDQALALIECTRTTSLAAMFSVFAEARQAILQSDRELVIILDHGTEALAVTADAADAVETLLENDMMELPAMLDPEGAAVVGRTARRQQSEQFLLVLDPGKLFPGRTPELEAVTIAA
jgi:chemotaxis signal transduction protein